jgi:gamma-glutamylputrescine oxidase
VSTADVDFAAHPWGDPPWRVDVALPRAPLPEHVEVAVVGAGFTGLATALRCAARGASVHVLEAGAIGSGASGRSGGIALEGTAAGALPAADSCLAALHALVAEHAIDCDLELHGCWTVRHVRRGVPPPAPRWPDDGAWLVLDRREPGGALDPGKLVAGLARAALRAGAVLHERAPVAALEPGPPAKLRVGERSIAAERVVLAVNAFLSRFVPGSGIRPALTLALATAPLAPDALAAVGLGATPFYTADLPYLWGRATRDGRLVVGAGLAFDEADHVERVAVARDDVRAAFERLASRVRGLHPALAGIEISHVWGGPIAFRTGGAPVLAETAPGVLATGACAGHGVALAAAIGTLAARWSRDGTALPSWGGLA